MKIHVTQIILVQKSWITSAESAEAQSRCNTHARLQQRSDPFIRTLMQSSQNFNTCGRNSLWKTSLYSKKTVVQDFQNLLAFLDHILHTRKSFRYLFCCYSSKKPIKNHQTHKNTYKNYYISRITYFKMYLCYQ